MKNDRATAVYLFCRLLVVVSIFAILYGIGCAILNIVIASRCAGKLVTLKKYSETMNTYSLQKELNNTISVLYSLGIAYDNPPSLDVPVGVSTKLNVKQMRFYLKYIEEVQGFLSLAKNNYLADYKNSISTLLMSIPLPVQEQRAFTQYSEVNRPQLYTDDISGETIRIIEICQEFLKNQISLYTPSPKASELASVANKNLDKVRSVMVTDAFVYEENSKRLQQAATDSAAMDKPSGGEVLIQEFYNKLVANQFGVETVALSHWRVDEVLTESSEAITAFLKEYDEERSQYKVAMQYAIFNMIKELIASLIAALLLLVFRQLFLSIINIEGNTAVTAANTAVAASQLSKIQIEVE